MPHICFLPLSWHLCKRFLRLCHQRLCHQQRHNPRWCLQWPSYQRHTNNDGAIYDDAQEDSITCDIILCNGPKKDCAADDSAIFDNATTNGTIYMAPPSKAPLTMVPPNDSAYNDRAFNFGAANNGTTVQTYVTINQIKLVGCEWVGVEQRQR
jgi:hypothetical protein